MKLKAVVEKKSLKFFFVSGGRGRREAGGFQKSAQNQNQTSKVSCYRYRRKLICSLPSLTFSFFVLILKTHPTETN